MPIPQSVAEESPYRVESVNLAEVQSANVLKATPNSVFLLSHHPDNWEIGHVDGQAYWLPEFAPRWVVPGVCMCRTIRADEPKENAYRGMIEWLTKRGEFVVPMEAVVGDTTSYLARVQCRDPVTRKAGYRYLDAWSTPKVTKAGRSVKVNRDDEAYNRWRLELVQQGWTMPDGTAGRIPDADPDVIAASLDRTQGHLERKEAETGLPERAYEREVQIRRDQLETQTGARVASYVGRQPAQVADYSAVVVGMLSDRVAAGEDIDAVLASVPGLTDEIAEAVRASVPAPKAITRAPAPKKARR